MSEPQETADAASVAPEETVVAAPTVGQRLRAAREAAHLTVVDVAQSLKFSPRQVEALEADDYAALPGSTVVRGFARSYARLLHLEADELLRALDPSMPIAPADVRPPDNMGEALDATATRQLTPVVSVTVVVALAALILGVWQVFGPPSKGSSTAAPVAAEAPAQTLATPVPADVAASAAPVAPAQPSESAAAETGVPPVTAPVAAVMPPTLLFVFDDRSWLEVSDADKQMLHTGENLAGTRLTLSGKPPFDIVVGNASRVKLTYGEREIDLAPYTRADVARLKVE